MKALTATSPPAVLPGRLITDYINYIDRSEKTTRTYINNIRQFTTWSHVNEITQPVRNDVIKYRDYLLKAHKPNTVKQYLQSLRNFFKWTALNGYYPNIAENVHAPKVRQDHHSKEALTAKDVLLIENSIDLKGLNKIENAGRASKDQDGRKQRAAEQAKRLKAIYLLAVNAGLRTIEISRANVKDLELKNGNAILWVYGKGHAEADQKKPLAPQVYQAVKEYLDTRNDSYTLNSPLFVSTGNRAKGKRIAPTTISTMLKRAMIEAGYNSERITAHSLRHTAGTNVQEITNNLYATQKYMRHANPATTEIYLHNDTERQDAEIANRLYNHYHNIEKETDSRQALENALAGLSAENVQRLASIAAAMK